jgi:TRAP-type C4-dicarboxylate transport system permease large subunit
MSQTLSFGYFFDVSLRQVVKGVLPFMIAAIVAVIIITFIPQIVLFLPDLSTNY